MSRPDFRQRSWKGTDRSHSGATSHLCPVLPRFPGKRKKQRHHCMRNSGGASRRRPKRRGGVGAGTERRKQRETAQWIGRAIRPPPPQRGQTPRAGLPTTEQSGEPGGKARAKGPMPRGEGVPQPDNRAEPRTHALPPGDLKQRRPQGRRHHSGLPSTSRNRRAGNKAPAKYGAAGAYRRNQAPKAKVMTAWAAPSGLAALRAHSFAVAPAQSGGTFCTPNNLPVVPVSDAVMEPVSQRPSPARPTRAGDLAPQSAGGPPAEGLWPGPTTPWGYWAAEWDTGSEQVWTSAPQEGEALFYLILGHYSVRPWMTYVPNHRLQENQG